jgi:hypothetical protein
MSNTEQTKPVEFIRELTLDELYVVSGGGDDAGDDDGIGRDGGGPLPSCNPPAHPC